MIFRCRCCCCYCWLLLLSQDAVVSFVTHHGYDDGQCWWQTTTANRRRHNNAALHPQQESSIQLTATEEASSYGLYEVQEEMITKRAQLEEKLMAGAPSSPIQPNKPKGAGSSGGFGGGAAKKGKKKKAGGGGGNKASSMQAQAKGHAQVLRDQGVVCIEKVLTGKMADEIKEFAIQLRQEALDQVQQGTVSHNQRFADVLLRKNRCDLTMPLCDTTFRGLQQVLCQSSVGLTLQELLTPQAQLYEFSCLMSDPGSDRQVVHPDTPQYNNDHSIPVLYTCFIALQDVTTEMGPTLWLPNTHTTEAHEQFFQESPLVEGEASPKDQLLASQPAVMGLLKKGSCGIFDSRLLHCGTANRSPDDDDDHGGFLTAPHLSRALFYFSFKNPNIGYPGNPASIRPELTGGKLRLDQLRQQLDDNKGQPGPELQAMANSMR